MTNLINISKIAVALFIICCLTSCFSSKNKMTKTARVIATAKEMQADEAGALKIMNQEKLVKFDTGDLDSTLNSKISIKLDLYSLRLDSFGNAISFIEQALSKKSVYRENKSQIKKNLALIKSYMNDSSFRLRRFQMVGEGIRLAKKNEFSLAAFFGPGKYQIPTEKAEEAEKAFAPIIDSLIVFYNKYNDVPRSATLIILGFADGTGFNPQSDTYKTLAEILNNPAPPKEILNAKLSELRAQNLGNTMETILTKRISNFYYVKDVDFSFVEIGRGETFPNKNITDYTVNDERRRVVLFYWNILPKG